MTEELEGGADSNPKPSNSVDEIVRKRDFQRAQGVDITSFMVDTEDDDAEINVSVVEEVEDIAVGQVASLFSSGEEEFSIAGAVQPDGTVSKPPENDSVTDLAVEGEKRLGFGLLVAMVLTWSAIGAIVGTVLPEIPSGVGLLAMGVLGL